MKRMQCGLIIAIVVGFVAGTSLAQDMTRKDPSQAMRELRVQFLSSSAASLGFAPTREYPRIFGVAMDWPLGEHTATVVSALDGFASLYTTSTFGVIGGAGHQNVRAAALRFVKAADAHYQDSMPTGTYSYPAKGKVRFYLRTFTDVRVIETDAASVYSTSGPYSALFRFGQAVVTELRTVAEQKR